jgi:type II restriction enzyme
LKASVIEARADTADVEAEGPGYKVVGDAKAFRLSRTAKNQKDFKVEALNQWRKNADYAVLVAPIYQYPKRTSQIYNQACRFNVTLLSYTHFAYLIRHGGRDPRGLRELFEVGKKLSTSSETCSNAEVYWSRISSIVCGLTKTSEKQWSRAVRASYDRLPEQAKAEIEFWEEEKRRVAALPKEVAVAELIKALKIDAKIKMIRKTAAVLLSESE